MRKVLVISGPNLNMLGSREPEIYGTLTLAEIYSELKSHGVTLGLEVDARSSNSESEIIEWLHSAAKAKTPVIINPAAFTHYSYALRDACAQRTAPIIEVHISNPHAREEFRSVSVISPVVTGVIAGFGANSFKLALQAIADLA